MKMKDRKQELIIKIIKSNNQQMIWKCSTFKWRLIIIKVIWKDKTVKKYYI